MKKFFINTIKYVKKIFLTVVIICMLIIMISKIFKFKLSGTFLYSGLICLILGGFSLIGNIKISSSYRYFQVQSISRPIDQISADNYKSRDSSLRFLIFMSSIGAILLLISNILIHYNL
ncbi:MAG TPA: hypothetical protein DD429_06570 [Clostridiaceae bacterium]|nr:hypothetical protein [Clostridiaceae bacterium]